MLNFIPADAKFLDQYRGNWDTLRISGYINHLDPGVKNEFVAIYRRNLDPRLVVCMHCQEDYLAMIRVLYTNFEKWEAMQLANLADAMAPEPIDPPAPDPVGQVPFPDVLDTIDPPAPDPVGQVPFPDVLDTIVPDVRQDRYDDLDKPDQVPVEEKPKRRGRPKKSKQ